MAYKKLSDDLFIKETISPDPISLSKLKAERDRLVAESKAGEPTDAELIELGKSMHPFYIDNESQILRLNKIITELEKL